MNRALVAISILALTGCATAAQSALESQATTNRDPQARMNQEEMQRRYVDNPDMHSSSCVEGTVTGAGPTGGPLEGVVVKADDRSTRTDLQGHWRICFERDDRGAVAGALVGVRYSDRPVKAQIAFTRAGWQDKNVDLDWSTGDRGKKIDVVLEKAAP